MEDILVKIKLLEKLVKMGAKFRKQRRVIHVYHVWSEEAAKTIANLEIRKDAMEKGLSSVYFLSQNFDNPNVFGGKYLLELQKHINQRFRGLMKQLRNQKHLIQFEKQKDKKLSNTLKRLYKQRNKLQEKYQSVLNTDGLRQFLQMNLEEYFESCNDM